MTFKQLGTRLADPIILGGLILAVLGEVQAQSDVLLSWLSPTTAGRVLSLIGILGVAIRWVQALPTQEDDPDDNQQAGFARPGMLAVLLVVASICTTMAGCTGTREAYRAAAGQPHVSRVEAMAYVVTEHYTAVVSEAANLRQSGLLTAGQLQALRDSDNAARPLILGDPTTHTPGLADLVETYRRVQDAKTEAELQAAINTAAIKLSDLINAVKAARR